MKKFILKIISLLFLLFTFTIPIFGQNTGFITLKGRQFYDSLGKTFYPVLLDYSVEFAFYNSTSYILAPWIQCGSTTDFECHDIPSCDTTITRDLRKIKNMGFNMIRPVFTPNWDTTRGRREIYMTGWRFGGFGILDTLFFQQPYDQDVNVQNYFTYLEYVASEAAKLGMYTMVTGVLGDLSDPYSFDKYHSFLRVLGKHFKNNKNIAFYDILSEPSNNYLHLSTKYQSCELVNGWYDTLKTADPNHLITGCNTGLTETKMMDIGLTKLDFSEPHPYSNIEKKDGYNITNMLNRVKGQLYWLGKNCPIPWIEGETGFRSSDTCYPPVVDGSNAQQKNYADISLADTRNDGGSGFVWWEYQDVFFDGYGLLKHGDLTSGNDTAYDKPAVKSFQHYLDPVTHQPPLSNHTLFVKPPNYYDPYLNGQYNTFHTNAVHGFIYDTYNNPIEDAYIAALNWLYFNDNNTATDTSDDHYFHSWIYTFSDSLGHFEVIPYNDTLIGQNRINHIEGSAVGAEPFNKVHWSGRYGWKDVQMPTNVGTITLLRNSFQNISIIKNQTVTSGNTVPPFEGGMTLDVYNTLINGNADFTAREDININSEFEAGYGSEVHIFPSETFADCNSYSNFQLQRNSNYDDGNSQNDVNNKGIELIFKLSDYQNSITVYPNPSNGNFLVKLNSEDRNLFLKKINVFDITGRIIFTIEVNTKSYLLNLSSLPKGIYFLNSTDLTRQYNNKIIIN